MTNSEIISALKETLARHGYKDADSVTDWNYLEIHDPENDINADAYLLILGQLEGDDDGQLRYKISAEFISRGLRGASDPETTLKFAEIVTRLAKLQADINALDLWYDLKF